MDIRDTIVKYGVVLGKRYSRKERNNFCNEIGKDFTELGYSVRGAVSKKKSSVGMNLMVGDPATAKVIVVANYDTPAKNFGNPLRYFPMDGPASFSSSFLPTNAPLILTSIFLLVAILYLGPKISFKEELLLSLGIMAVFIGLMVLSVLFIKGFGNRANLNRNSSSIITILTAAEMIKPAQRKKVAFVLTDGGCNNHQGDHMLREALPKTIDDRKIIILDCVGVGESLAVGYRVGNEMLANQMIDCLDSEEVSKVECKDDVLKYTSFSFYKKAILICRGQRTEQTVFVENTGTKADNDINIKYIENLATGLAKMVEKL